MSPGEVAEGFEAAGFLLAEDAGSSRTRRDRAVVFSASRLDPDAERTRDLIISSGITYGFRPSPYSQFQPVWDVSRWSSTGLELLVIDDNDACTQLDALSEGLCIERELITISPRVGWQGYGHPDVMALG
jgi:hypothetical protein